VGLCGHCQCSLRTHASSPRLSLCLHRLAIDTHPFVPSIFRRISPQSCYRQHSDRPEPPNTMVARGLEDSELGPSTTALSDSIVFIGFPHSFVRLLLVFLIRTSARFLPTLAFLYSTSHPPLCPSISNIATHVCRRQDRRYKRAPFHLPFTFKFHSLVRSVLVPNCVSQPYKYPCARLAEKQATVAQSSLPSLICVLGNRGPFPSLSDPLPTGHTC